MDRKDLSLGQEMMIVRERRGSSSQPCKITRVGRTIVEVGWESRISHRNYPQSETFVIATGRGRGDFYDRVMPLAEYRRLAERASTLGLLKLYDIEPSWRSLDSWTTQQLVDLLAAVRTIRGSKP